MAKVELEYNPYLLETGVTINGNRPRINSLLKKYYDRSLYSWIDKMPSILYDEMNGYDFVLDFSGTSRDYDAIKTVFSGIPDVDVFHKKCLGDRYQKTEKIDDLFCWLKNSGNRRFDHDLFRKENEDLFDDPYPFLVFNGGKFDDTIFKDLDIKVESIDDWASVEGTDLTNVPLLICIDDDSAAMLEDAVRKLSRRSDIISDQLFFLIHPSLNENRVIRTLNDLDIDEPHIVNHGDISDIKDYIELYPVTAFIREAVTALMKNYKIIRSGIEDDLKRNAVSNKDITDKIGKIDDGIESIKAAIEKLENRNNINVPYKCRTVMEELIQNIMNWRKRKAKITEKDALEYAYELEAHAKKYFMEFTVMIDDIFSSKKDRLENKYLGWYREAGADREYVPDLKIADIPYNHTCLNIALELLDKEHECNEDEKDGFGFFVSQKNNGGVREITYYCHEWREKAVEIVLPLADRYINCRQELLIGYEKSFADKLVKHLGDIIKTENEKKSSVVAQMSEAERRLQNDADWLRVFNYKIESIVRD